MTNALQERQAFYERWAQFEKWLTKTQKKMDAVNDVYSDEVNDVYIRTEVSKHQIVHQGDSFVLMSKKIRLNMADRCIKF